MVDKNFLSVQTKDVKFRSIDESVKSPSRSPSKYRDIQTIATGVSSLKIENKIPKKHTKLVQYFGNPDAEVFCIKIDEEDSFLAGGTTDGVIRVYSLANGNLINNLVGSDTYTPTTCLRWRPHAFPSKSKAILLSGNADGNISQWHAGSGKIIHQIIEKNNQILALDYNNSGNVFASAGKDFKIRIYDETTKNLTLTFNESSWQSPGHSNRIFALKFLLTDSNILLSGGWDSSIYIWDIREKKSVGSLHGPNISGDALDFKNDEILAGSLRNVDNLELWDFKTRKRIRSLQWDYGKNEENYIYAAQFSKNDKINGNETILAGSSGSNEVKLFDCNNGYRTICNITGFEKACYTVDYGNISNIFAFSGADGVIYVCNLNNI